ncbi:MAG: thiamine-phosphate kinase, partial [Desulfobulbaceae bacterium]|nr:thiamine-phosphate kinase [Desulfobulbaceae bacterium]
MKERDIIERISRLVGTDCAGLVQGIGDDCAVIEKTDETVWLLTMDTLVESVHFDCAFHPPEKLGRKAVSVNVSDIAAMGGKPVFVLLSLGLPAGFDSQWLDQLCDGITDACRDYGCLLIGGDTVCSPDRAALTLTVIGEMRKDQVIYRHGARAGDTVWVSGPLGYSAAGLDLFRSEKLPDIPEFFPLLEKHLNPQARADLAPLLADSGLIHAMMDLSDGLATDLSHLCKQSQAGARIMADQLPGFDKLSTAATLLKKDQLDWMVFGGEDYELLFTTDPADSETLLKITAKNDLTIYPVGTIIEGQGVTLIGKQKGIPDNEKNISYQGFDHFRKR